VQLIETLRGRLAHEPSMFHAQLLREDIARLVRLESLAGSAASFEAFSDAARRLGWTQGDARTPELAEPLDALLDAVYATRNGSADAAQDARIEAAWRALYRLRLERLVGCLSPPVPKPVD
jgi:hypothetical protein